jgi:hypothetical protein
MMKKKYGGSRGRKKNTAYFKIRVKVSIFPSVFHTTTWALLQPKQKVLSSSICLRISSFINSLYFIIVTCSEWLLTGLGLVIGLLDAIRDYTSRIFITYRLILSRSSLHCLVTASNGGLSLSSGLPISRSASATATNSTVLNYLNKSLSTYWFCQINLPAYNIFTRTVYRILLSRVYYCLPRPSENMQKISLPALLLLSMWLLWWFLAAVP